MSELTKEQYEQLPDFAKDAFAEDGDKYVPVKDAKLKSTLDDLDGKYKTEAQKRAELEQQLAEFKQTEEQKIKEARDKALAEAETKGDAKKVREEYEQRMEDLKKRSDDTLTEKESTIKKLTGTLKSREKTLLAAKLASDLATDVGRDLFSEVVQNRIDVDLDTGKPVFLNADGSASSLDLEGFKEELKKDARLKPLLKSGAVTSGGGMANGSNGQGSASTGKANMGGTRDERKAAIAQRFNL